MVGFHGTGGDERQMLNIVRAIDPKLAYFSPKGKVLEDGVSPRYFRRFEEGVLDIEDLKHKAAELAEWLPSALAAEGMSTRPTTAIGYSNGASISAALLMLYPQIFDQVILLRPMVPFCPETKPNLKGKRVLICASPEDRVTPFEGAEELGELLSGAGAMVECVSVPGGHALGLADIKAAQNFLAGFGPR